MKETKGKFLGKSKGVTLVALVVTIVILIILASVSINVMFGENGLIQLAQNAKKDTLDSIAREETELNLLAQEYANIMATEPETPQPPEDTTGPTVSIATGNITEISIDVIATASDPSGLATSGTYKFFLDGKEKTTNTTGSYTFTGLTAGTSYTIKVEAIDKLGNVGSTTKTVKTISKPVIPTTTNYVGYYANLDSDPEPEGVIYADLATGKKGDGQWSGYNDGNYDIPKKTGLKDYYISKTEHSGKFGTKDVLTATGTGEERFYVMALEDIKENTQFWYESAYINEMSDYATATSPNFGKGRTNTATMMNKWNKGENGGYGQQSSDDVWGVIKTQVSQGWFVPSKEEWNAFAEELGITSLNYSGFGLEGDYWSSSQYAENSASVISFRRYLVYGVNVNFDQFTRLSTTF